VLINHKMTRFWDFAFCIFLSSIKCEIMDLESMTKSNMSTSTSPTTSGVELDDVDVDTIEDKYSSMKECPFPPAETIDPCKCFGDERNRKHLVCNLERNMDEDFLSNLVDNFGCQNEIFSFYVNLNGFTWGAKFSEDNFGRLKITKFVLENAMVLSNISAGTLTSSKNSIREFMIAESVDGFPTNSIESGAFKNLDNLQIVELGNHFSRINSMAFQNLHKLEEIRISKSTISVIQSQAFSNLALTEIDLSEQLLENIQLSTFNNLRNITKINLSSNMLSSINDQAFMAVPSLTNLDISNNTLCRLGGALKELENPDLVVNLSNNQITYLIESDFKPYIETRKNKGYIDFTGNNFRCKCDFKWLSLTNFRWNDLLKNGTCSDGKTFDQVDAEILKDMCPNKDCVNYNEDLGRMKKYKLHPSAEFIQSSAETCSGYYRNHNRLQSTMEYRVENKSNLGFLSIINFTCHSSARIQLLNEEKFETIDVDEDASKMKVGWRNFKIRIYNLRDACSTCSWNILWEEKVEEEPEYCF